MHHAVQLLWDEMTLVSDLGISTLAFLRHGVVVHLVKETREYRRDEEGRRTLGTTSYEK